MVTKGYGFTVNDIDMSCPADLEPYAKAYNLEQQERDALVYAQVGEYIIPAVTMAVRSGAWGKGKLEYAKKPIYENAKIANSEEEVQRQREVFVAGLMAMQANYEITHPKKDNGE